MNPHPPITLRPRWQRWVWLLCGVLSLITGVVGIVLPLLPTTRFGPMVRDWRAQRALPLRAKQLAMAMWLWRLPTRKTEPRLR
ncbi:hypothetical protein [Rhodoferax ferrireducens]|uniref:hypothetical protein n=1 Tax=Rhodoferax ferrireducens TaxID=192843 RepID=UPI000E0CCC86|nr:hypothetical protein [Rhodoferax ferrireducens]